MRVVAASTALIRLAPLATFSQREKDFEEALLMGNAVRGQERSRWLERADGRLVCLRALLRYAYDLQLLAGNQVAHAASLVDELGRMLGAWRKGVDRSAPAPIA